ncbi:hypothetical protein RM549_17590 [Salegentibacter sp. F188]|uniref:PRC-barrel domain-containing protein n=1 Tax=Autumnicola patrickiae TaxID=3075591 RepID=A0ABU3E6J3_9FLAO|nr:hypothetical protein [Salegentibacter sp. F188]MDT0691609.1 hypothetical protein [Salegentibacter sp. F188]
MSTKNKNQHLFHFSELSDYKINSKDPDIRGWAVKDSDNRVIGKVDNLLVNKDIEKVVYLDVEVDSTIIEANHDPYGKPANEDVHEFVNKEGENHVIIPVGMVGINRDQKFVYTDTIDHRTFAETKRYRSGSHIDRGYEETVLQSYNRSSSTEKARIRKNRDRDLEYEDNSAKIIPDEEIRRKEIETQEHPRHRETSNNEKTRIVNAEKHADTSYDKDFRSEREKRQTRDHDVMGEPNRSKSTGSDRYVKKDRFDEDNVSGNNPKAPKKDSAYDQQYQSEEQQRRPENEDFLDESDRDSSGNMEDKEGRLLGDPFYKRTEFHNKDYDGRREF